MKKGPVTPKGFRGFLPLKISKNARVGVFIDEANLFYIQKELGWKIDWEKFASTLKKNFNIVMFRYYLGMPLSGEAKIKNLKFKKKLESFGYTIVTKPLKKIYVGNKKEKFRFKCNFDVEIALDIASFIDKLDLIIIVSGDSDFVAAKDFILSKNKEILFVCFEKRVSWEIRQAKYIFIENLRNLLELR